MIPEGEQAPPFELPGAVDGEFKQVGLDEYLGENIIILAFYPGDFNPACSETSTDLDELDLFTMQKDVSILAISADSIYSHQAFADEYDLHIPLLSDTRGTVSETYGVAVEDEDAGYLTRRAVVVIDHTKTVEYTWVADDIDQLPNVDAVRDAVRGIGGAETAQSRYRVGYAHYIEGRRSFTSAMGAFEQSEWMMAQGDFQQAFEEFDTAADEFNTAVRFAEDDETLKYYERAEKKAESLWQAAEWLSTASKEYASGEGAEGQSMREDAEGPLRAAREIHEPPDPDNFPPEEDPAEKETEERSILPTDDEEVDASLDASFDEESDAAEESEITIEDSEVTAEEESQPAGASEPIPAASQEEIDQPEPAQAESDIDDAELEEITAALEQQTEAAQEQTETEEIEDDSLVPDKLSLEPQEGTDTQEDQSVVPDTPPSQYAGDGTDTDDATESPETGTANQVEQEDDSVAEEVSADAAETATGGDDPTPESDETEAAETPVDQPEEASAGEETRADSEEPPAVDESAESTTDKDHDDEAASDTEPSVDEEPDVEPSVDDGSDVESTVETEDESPVDSSDEDESETSQSIRAKLTGRAGGEDTDAGSGSSDGSSDDADSSQSVRARFTSRASGQDDETEDADSGDE